VEWVGVMVRRCWGCFVNDDEDDDCIDDDNDEVFVNNVLTADCCSDTINTFLLTLTMSICNN